MDTKVEADNESLWSQFIRMTREGISYLSSSDFGAFVFLKCSAALIFGSADVLNAAFSQQLGSDSRGSSELLGLLFAFVGVGCIIGPLIVDPMTDMKSPLSLVRACVVSLFLIGVGYLGMASFAPVASLCLFTIIRAAGSAVAWVDSSLILQKFSVPEMLGRVTAVEYSLATMGEAVSALLAGLLQDALGFTAEGVSLTMAILGLVLTVAWLPLVLKDTDTKSTASPSCGKGITQRRSQETPTEECPLLSYT